MATVVLQTVGAAIGGAVGGPVGAALGRAAGAAIGYAVDQQFLTKDQVVTGPRLDGTQLLSSSEGAPIPKVYGRNRISGQIIWATRFEEVITSRKSGGKGTSGPSSRSTTFSYFANFAVGICDGPVSGMRRIWADGKELDLDKVEYRFYKGDDEQEPDPLIEAKQGAGNAPAYRGTTYIVFESFPLEVYGNRIPQLSFEVIRSVGRLENDIRSITVIPGSTEFGYNPELVSNGGGEETYAAHNRHNSIAESDWAASIDELQMLCPNLESVSLVVTWFGNDLRAGECLIRPGVTQQIGVDWRVAGLFRSQAHLVSTVDEKPAFGGTPDDKSVLNAITDLKARGLKVVLYPFVMMDVPEGNTLPGLHGESSQPVYPWRGEISCAPAPGELNTVDKTTTARTQLDDFKGSATASEFQQIGGVLTYSGSAEFRYRHLILHYAKLCEIAGGVDGFLIGSEMKGMTRVRDQTAAFPFVEALSDLADEVKLILGNGCSVSYAADWSEYFGYQPQDGSNDVLFNLDSLWASSSIDAVGIDNYMPLADWRDEGDPEDTDTKSPHDITYLKSNIANGEGYDWYYTSQADRNSGNRTTITDGQSEPWIFRYKDLVSWWSNPHHDRIAGVRSSNPTAWQPEMKPIFLTEIGCPAVDKGANQPNVFPDPKSDQSALPYHSSGGRDDLIQRRFMQAHFDHWRETANNPVSQTYSAPMLSVEAITPWAWDARPFPWFPLDTDAWSDGGNWNTGHWLNGRLGGCPIQDLVVAILKDYGHENVICTLDGYADGYTVPNSASARTALEPLLALYGILVTEEDGNIVFRQRPYAHRETVERADIVQEDDPKITKKRDAELELPAEAVISHGSVFGAYEQSASKSRRIEGGSERQITLQAPIVLPQNSAANLANTRLREDWSGREVSNLSLPNRYSEISAGDIIQIADEPNKNWLVEGVETGIRHDLALRSVSDFPSIAGLPGEEKSPVPGVTDFGQPLAILMDLPLLKTSDVAKTITHFAVFAEPWAGSYAVFSSPSNDGFVQREIIQTPAIIGTLQARLDVGPLGVWDNASKIHVTASGGNLESREDLLVLNGANAIALETASGGFEILQFATAELQQDGSWILSKLLRGQLGTEHNMLSGSPVGSRLVLLDEAINPVELQSSEIGIEQNWRIGPAREDPASGSYIQTVHANLASSRKLFSPVHLKSVMDTFGDQALTWIRRGRIDSDNWEGAEIPFDVASEEYRVRILDGNGSLKREFTSTVPETVYTHADRMTDFNNVEEAFQVTIAQIGDNGLGGYEAELAVTPAA